MAGHDYYTPEGIKFLKEIEELQKLQVRVGVQAGASYPDGTDVYLVAATNELGTSRIPSRPFLRQSVEGNESEIQSLGVGALQVITRGGSVENSLSKLGQVMSDKVKDTITNGSFAPNSAVTIARKGSSKPLIDTGLLRQSITYQITEKE